MGEAAEDTCDSSIALGESWPSARAVVDAENASGPLQHLFGVLSLVVVVEIFIYIRVVLWAGLLFGSIKFYLLCCAKEVNLYN